MAWPSINMSSFATSQQIDALEDKIPSPSSENPESLGDANSGQLLAFSRGDHVHPTSIVNKEFTMMSTQINMEETPQSPVSGGGAGLFFTDNNNRHIAEFLPLNDNEGYSGFSLNAIHDNGNSNYKTKIELKTNENNQSKIIFQPKNSWLQGLGFKKIVGNTITQGIFTPATSITIIGSTFTTYGFLCMWMLTFSHSNSYTANSSYSIGTLNSITYQPVQYTIGQSYNIPYEGTAKLTPSGILTYAPTSSRSAGSTEYICFPAYILNTANS